MSTIAPDRVTDDALRELVDCQSADAWHVFCEYCWPVLIPPRVVGAPVIALCGIRDHVPDNTTIYRVDTARRDVCAACRVRMPTHDCLRPEYPHAG